MRAKRSDKSVLYVNYSPYENSGHILDYLLENFSRVYLVSLGFYYLGTKQKSNYLTIYEQKKEIRKYSLYQIPIPPGLVFWFLPIKSIINLVHIIFWGLILYRRYGRIDYFLSVNGYTATIGNIVRSLGFVRKTVFWVWDYYPPTHTNKIVAFMRTLYWQFDKWATRSDRVVYVNSRLMNLRKSMGLVQHKHKIPIVSIGTQRFTVNFKKKISTGLVFGFIGVLKKSHGLGIVFDYAHEIMKEFPDSRYEIIGAGPDEKYFKRIAKQSPMPSFFYGYVDGDTTNNILRTVTVGIATYIPDTANVSYFGDPGKIKHYLSLGIPVIATDVVEFSKVVKGANAGVVIDGEGPESFMRALRKIKTDYQTYAHHALLLSDKYYYKNIYRNLFV